MLINPWLCCCSCREVHLYWKSCLSVEIKTLRTTLTPLNPRAGFVMPLPWLSCMNQSYLGCIPDKWEFSKIILFYCQPYLPGWRIWYYVLKSKNWNWTFFGIFSCKFVSSLQTQLHSDSCVLSSLCGCCRKDALSGFFFNLFHGELSFSHSFKLYRLCNSSFKLDWQWEDWKINASRMCLLHTVKQFLEWDASSSCPKPGGHR